MDNVLRGGKQKQKTQRLVWEEVSRQSGERSVNGRPVESWGRCGTGAGGREPAGLRTAPARRSLSVRPRQPPLKATGLCWARRSDQGLQAAGLRTQPGTPHLGGHRPPPLGHGVHSAHPLAPALTTVRRALPTPVLALARVSGQPEFPDPGPLVPSGGRSGPGTCRAALVCRPATEDAGGGR